MQQAPSMMGQGLKAPSELAARGAAAALGKAAPDTLCIGRLYQLNPWGRGDTVCSRKVFLAEGWEEMGFVAGRELCGKRGRGRGDLGDES